MFKELNVSVIRPKDIPGLTLDSIEFGVYKNIELTDIEEVINKSGTDMFYYSRTLDFSTIKEYYLRSRFKYIDNNDGSVIYSGWTAPAPVREDNILKFKYSDNIIVTPRVYTTITYDSAGNGTLTVKGTEFKMFTGNGTHIKTKLYITKTSGEEVLKLEKDTGDLLTFDIPLSELNENVLVIKLKYFTEDTYSFYGKTLINLDVYESNKYELIMPYDLVNDRWQYFKLNMLVPGFKSIDIIIKDTNGNVLLENLNQETFTPRILTTGLVFGETYDIYSRINYTDGSSDFEQFNFNSMCFNNYLLYTDNNLQFEPEYSFVNNIDTNGAVIQTSRQFYSGDVLIAKHNSKILTRCEVNDDELVEIETGIVLNTQLTKPNIHIVQLYNGRILIDYDTGTDYTYPVFELYDFNPITKEFTLLASKVRTDELGSTANSNSLVPMKNDLNYFYYIPRYKLLSGSTDHLDLSIHKVDIETLNIDYLSEINISGTTRNLPFQAKTNVTMCEYDSSNILILGGSGDAYEDPNTDNLVFDRTNDAVYLFNIQTKAFTQLGTIDGIVDISLYNLNAFLRKDNKIIIFNGTDSSGIMTDRSYYLLDKIDNSITKVTSNFNNNVAYRSFITMQDGRIELISSKPEGLQDVYKIGYIVEGYDNTPDDVSTLLVEANTVMMIENPNLYSVIKIDGTSYTDTGVLQWLDENNNLIEYRYRDLLVLGEVHIQSTDDYDSITIFKNGVLITDD